MTNYSENYDLDLQIAENNSITVDMVDQIPLHIVEIMRNAIRKHAPPAQKYMNIHAVDLGEVEPVE